ncbi:FAD-dependent thymidylate synthase [candidate division KSB1 bacterium]
MPVTKEAQKMLGKRVPVLDKGFVGLIDVMGDDSSIVQAARVSYGKGTKSVSIDRGLIRYLMKHRHTTPFEMVEMKFHVKLPIFVARQWIRHRTANVNEYSARYSILEKEFYIPETDVMAEQSKSNKQGREETLPAKEAKKYQKKILDHSQESYDLYNYLLNEEDSEDFEPERSNLARELSRMVIPTNIYTQWYWKIDLHNLLHFLGLRLDAHAQYEIRQYAQVMAEMVKAAVPLAWEAFEDYRLNSIYFSSKEKQVLLHFLKKAGVTDKEFEKACDEAGMKNKFERREFTEMFKRFMNGDKIPI